MNHFAYRNGRLHVEDVAIADIADRVGTPVYIYSSATLRRHYRIFATALSGGCPAAETLICYALKANSNQAVIATLGRLGAGADVVSEGELRRVLAAGIPPEKIVFSGVGKTAGEMRAALEADIRQFNVESEPELQVLSEVASALGRTARITVRVNPDVDAGTHAKISTGRSENKFGVPLTHAREVYRIAATLPGIEVVGVDVHIGSQVTSLAPFERTFARIAELVHRLREDGHDIRSIDLGGGLGIPYGPGVTPPSPDAYAAVVNRTVGHLGCTLIFEPGRLIVGNAGVLASRVIYIKRGEGRDFAIVDAAMNDLIRPAMYDAHHDVLREREPAPDEPRQRYDLVGPICESADTFARDCEMPEIGPNDIICFESAGAYSAVMSSTYNSRPLVPEVLVDGERFAVVRPRPSLDDLIGQDRLPPWLEGDGVGG